MKSSTKPPVGILEDHQAPTKPPTEVKKYSGGHCNSNRNGGRMTVHWIGGRTDGRTDGGTLNRRTDRQVRV